MSFQVYLVPCVVGMATLFGCEPADGDSEFGGTSTEINSEESSGGLNASMDAECIICAETAPFYAQCARSEILADDGVRVCIDTEDDVECATLEVCCMQAGAEFDMDNQTCLTSDEQMMSTSGDGLACMTDDDCAMDFPRCELDATRMGTCTVECRSNDDCTDGPNGDFCQANNRCASAPDGTCQIETPDEPETANPECDGTTPICMPLSMGASLGICVECSIDAPCPADSERPNCSTKGICIADNEADECSTDGDCCPTPDADCAGQRICNDGQCESTTP